VELAGFTANPDANEVVCTTANLPAANYERRVKLDGVLMGQGNGTNELGVEFVASVDNGANWISLGPVVPFGTTAGRWSNARVSADRDVAPSEVVRYGLRVSRVSGVSGFADARCSVRVLMQNRTP
jgi:hypothetical protein